MKVLITGGTGSLGQVLSEAFLANGDQVTVLSRDPHKQAVMKEWLPKASYLLADIGCRESIMCACHGQDIVIGAAALKRVERGETDPREYLRVNVLGAMNTVEAARLCGARKALLISTDKSVEPTTFYGKTKSTAEAIWVANNNGTKCAALRYGNVVNSNGSVWHVWQDQIAKGLSLTVRDPEPTRFILTIEQAVQLVMDALRWMDGGEIFVPKGVPAFSLHELARNLQLEEQWCREPLGPGEKQHEILVAQGEYVEDVKGSRLLAKVWPKLRSDYIPDEFCSRTAHRLDANEVTTLLNKKRE